MSVQPHPEADALVGAISPALTGWPDARAALAVLAERLKAAEDTWELLQQSWECQRAASARVVVVEEERDAARAVGFGNWRNRAEAAEARLEAATDALRALVESVETMGNRVGADRSNLYEAAAAARAVLVGGTEDE